MIEPNVQNIVQIQERASAEWLLGKIACEDGAAIPEKYMSISDGITILPMRLQNKVAIITGGGSGIGKAIASAFVREGGHVLIAGRDSKKLALAVAEIGADCLAVTADVSRASDTQKLVSAALEKFKHIDILVNNAAVLLPGTAESISEEDFDQTFNINVRGLWLLSRAVLPLMRTAGGGSIINIGSVLSLLGARNRVAYSASKGAVMAMTKAMALDHAAENIRVNCISPALWRRSWWQSLIWTKLSAVSAWPCTQWDVLAGRKM